MFGYMEFTEMDLTDLKPSFNEVLAASWRLHNPIGSFMQNRRQAEEWGAIHEAETAGYPTYDPFEDERWSTPTELRAILASKSRTETAFILERVREADKDRDTLNQVSFGESLVPLALTQLVNPFNLFFLGAGTGVRQAIAMGLTIGAAEEIGYQLEQYGRPKEESIAFVLSSGAFFGVAGGIRKLIGPNYSTGITDDLLRELGDQLDSHIPNARFHMPDALNEAGLLPRLRPQTIDVDFSGIEPLAPLKKSKSPDINVQNTYDKGGNRVEKLTINTTRETDKISYADAPTPVRWLNRLQEIINPRSRLAASAIGATRKLVHHLLETPGYMTRNIKEGIATPTAVQSLIKVHEGALVKLIDDIEANFVKYRLRLKDEQGVGFIDPSSSIVGRFASPVRDKMSNDLGRLNVNEFRAMVTKGLRTNSEGITDKELLDSISQVRKFLDDYAKDAVNVGILKPEDLFKNYVPRMWDVMEVAKRKNELITRILKHQETKGVSKINRSEVESKVDAIINSGSSMENFRASGPRGIFSERTIDINEVDFEDFLITDIDDILKSYVRIASADIEIARKFGSVDMKSALDAIRKQGEAMIKRLDPKTDKYTEKVAKIAQQIDDDIQVAEALRDILRGIYGLPENPYSLSSRAARLALDFNNLIALGGATLSSLPDLARILATGGVSETFQTMKLMATHWKVYKAATAEVKLAGTALDMILQTRALAMFGNGSLAPRFTKLEAGVGYLTNGFFIANLLSPWNSFLKQTTGVIVTNNIIKQSIRWNKGTISDLNKSKLLALGIDETDSTLLARLHKEFGEVVDGVYMPNTQNWKVNKQLTKENISQETIDKLRTKFRAGLAKKVDETIVTPGAGDQPLWVHNQWGRFISQYKSFAFASANKVLVPAMQQRDAHQMMGILMMVFIGSQVQSMKDSIAGKNTNYSLAEIVANGLNRSGAGGIYMEFNNIVESLLGYGITSAAAGQRQRVFLEKQLGVIPVAGTAASLLKSMLGEGRMPLPYANLFYLEMAGINKLRDNFDKIIGNQPR